MIRFGLTVSAALIGLAVGVAPALAEFPTKDIRLIVPWGAGGGADAISRKIASLAEQNLPTSIYVENVDGGISSIGVSKLMSARPDGYTVGAMTYDSVITVPWKELMPGYDLGRLKILARVTSEANALMVGGDSSYNSFDEIIAAAKEAPNTIRVAITGVGGMSYLNLARLEDETGAKFRGVSYPDGAAGQKEAVLSGEAEAAITSLGDFASVLNSGDIKALVEFSEIANPAFPTVPISSDVGLQMENGSFIILAVPAETPDVEVNVLLEAFHTAFASDEFQQWTAEIGVTPAWLGPEEASAWVSSFQKDIYKQLDDLAAKGLLEK